MVPRLVNRLFSFSFPLSSLLPSHKCSSVDLSHICVFVRTPFFLFTFFKAEEKNEVRALLFQVWRQAKWLNATKWTTHTVKVLRVKIFLFFFHFQRLKTKFFCFLKAQCPSCLAPICIRTSLSISVFFHFHRNNFLFAFLTRSQLLLRAA
jgi:hypothetical protein